MKVKIDFGVKMSFLNKYVALAFIASLFFDVYAASLTEYRVYLDDNNRVKKYILGNSSMNKELCEIEFMNMRFDKKGKEDKSISPIFLQSKTEELLSKIKYSPSKITLEPITTQTVNFVLKRSVKNEEAKEYRAYIDFRCKKAFENTDKVNGIQVSVTPTIVQRVPIIIRTGELEANLSFLDIKRDNRNLDITFSFQGTRSVYGDLKLYSSDIMISQKKGIAIYPETSQKNVAINIPSKYLTKELKLVFEEREAFGGNIKIEKTL